MSSYQGRKFRCGNKFTIMNEISLINSFDANDYFEQLF